MKPKAALRHFLALALAGSSLLAISSADAQTTYTWTQTATGNQDWTTGTNWSGGNQFVSGSANELAFLTSLSLGAGTAITVTNVPTTLSMNVLTLNGIGPNSTTGSSITIGTSASTWTLGDGTATSTVNLNSTLGGGGADRDVRYTIGANLTLVGNASGITAFTGNGTSGIGALFSGNIGETVAGKGITKSGSSLLVFSGNNSYTGTTSVTGGVLRLSSANALSGGIGTTGGTSALTINGTGVVELGAGDFSRGLGTGSSQFQITGGTSGFSAFGGPRVVTVNGDASQELQWGSTHFAPGTLVLNQSYSTQAAVYANGSIELTNKVDLNGSTRTVQVGANIALLSNDIRTSTGTAGLTKTGAGTLVLTGINTYNGNTTLSAGVLSVDAANNLGGGSSNLVLNGGTLQIRGTTLTSLTGLGRTVSLTNNVNVGFDIHNAVNTFTVDQVLNNNSGTRTLTKSGVGTLVLNQNNTFTGATSAAGGALVLDSTTNNGSKLSDTAGLTLSGTALVLKGGVGAGANHAEVVSSTAITTYTSNSISRDGGTSTISLGGLTLNANASLGISESNIATTSTGNATVTNPSGGILSLGRVTVGSHFGANDGSGNIVAYSGYNAVTTAGGSTTGFVNQLTGGGTMGATLSSYALRIVNDANSNVLNLGSNNLSLLNNSTFLYAGGFDNNYTINGTGALTSASGNQPFVINTYAGTTLTVNARTSSNTSNVSKAGAGTLVFGGNNSTMAGVFVQEGVLRVTHKDGLGNTTSGTTVQGGAGLELANNIDVGAEALSLNGAGFFNGTSYGGALRNQSGTNSWSGAITIGTSGARINSDTGASLTLTGGITTTLTQDVTFGGAGNTTVSTTAISGSGSVIKDGAGTLTLSAANTYSGTTTATQGALITTSASSLPGYNAAGKVIFNGGTHGVRVGGAGWTTGQVDTLLTNATKTSGALGIDTTNGNLTQWTAFTTTNLGSTLGLTKLGTNTLTLDQANTYNGATMVSAGTLALGASGSIANSSTITVSTGATLDVSAVSGGWTLGASQTLGGTGTLTGAVTIDGNLSPGASPGVLSFGSALALGANSTTTMEIDGTTRGTQYDGVNVGSTFGLDGDLLLDIGAVLASDGTFDLFAVTGATSGDFDTVTLQGLMGTGSFSFAASDVWSFVDGSNTWTFTESTGDLSLTIIPEPGTALLGGLGLLLMFRRRR